MNKKTIFIYLGILILAVVVTYGISIIDALIRGNFLAGEAGLPFRFSYGGGMEGGESINKTNLVFDIVFWFVVILVIGKVFLKLIKR